MLGDRRSSAAFWGKNGNSNHKMGQRRSNAAPDFLHYTTSYELSAMRQQRCAAQPKSNARNTSTRANGSEPFLLEKLARVAHAKNALNSKRPSATMRKPTNRTLFPSSCRLTFLFSQALTTRSKSSARTFDGLSCDQSNEGTDGGGA
jgi:hypothetical protein